MKNHIVLQLLPSGEYRCWPSVRIAAANLQGIGSSPRSAEVQINATLNGRGLTAFGSRWFYMPAGSTESELKAVAEKGQLITKLLTVEWGKLPANVLQQVVNLVEGK